MMIFVRLLALSILTHCILVGADLTGIWMGEAPGRNGEKQDTAFQFKVKNGTLWGVMFGDESDLPVDDLKVDGDKISFSTTSINYYSGSRITLEYTGVISGNEIKLTRERKNAGPEPPEGDRTRGKQTLTLKRVTK